MKRIYLIAVYFIITPLFTQTMHTNQGFLFSIEGTEGCGKTTLIRKLSQKLSELQLNVITTREPGSTELGKTLRAILMNKSVETCTLAEYLLLAADRAQHFQEFIMPHLHNNYIVISDRMADSSLVYQGYVKGLDQSMMKIVNQWAMQYRQPDLVFYLRLDCATAMTRVEQRNKNNNETSVAFEQEILQKKQQLVDGFDTIFQNRTDVVTLDATASADEIAEQAFQAVLKFIQNKHE